MHNISRWRLKWTQKHSFHAFTSRYPSFTRRKRAFLLPTDKKTSLRLHISFSRKKFDHESRRNARVKETYRNSLRGIGLITREPVGFLLDLVRFHQRSHHFYLSLCLNVAFGFFFRVGCFFSLESKTSDTQKKIQTTKKNKKKKRQTKIQRTTIHPSIERERERDHRIKYYGVLLFCTT